MERINVTGTSCSGKTTLARRVAERLGMRCVELDALFWGPGWTPVPAKTFRRRVAGAAVGERWVIDGGYSSVRDLTWGRADTVVWLDYPLHLVLARWARRTVVRIRSGAEFWPGTGNRESLRHALRRDSLLMWILTTHRRRRRRLAADLAARPDLAAIRLRSPAATERWLATLGD
ncbi:MAG TPA: adenylate kinase [Candidatus Limnocylindria bacterium]